MRNFFARRTVVVLPYSYAGDSMLWQLESGWYFPWPVETWVRRRSSFGMADSSGLLSRWRGRLPAAGDQLKAFLATHRATAVLVDDREAAIWRPLMATLGTTRIEAGGMSIYRVSQPNSLPGGTRQHSRWRRGSTRRASLRSCSPPNYLHGGHPPAAITPAEVYKLGLMPAGWTVVPKKIEPPWDEGGMNLPRHPSDPHQLDHLWLAVDEQGRIEVGVTGWYPALRAVLTEYRADASGFVPRDLEQPGRGGEDDLRGRLVMTFNADGLARAASRARGETANNGRPESFRRGG